MACYLDQVYGLGLSLKRVLEKVELDLTYRKGKVKG